MVSSRPTRAEIVIVGAGPAGAAAAIVAARAGRDVVVVDRAEFPRDKTCGDGITTWALRLCEELGLDPDEIDSFTPVDRIHVSSPSRRVVTYPLPSGPGLYAAVARRSDLDAALLGLARASGAAVHEGVRCTGAEHCGDHLRVELHTGEVIETDWLIGADGMWSPTRRFLGTDAPGYLGDWHALRQYVRDVSPAAQRDLYVWFEPDILPGYVWSFPVVGGVNLGIGVRRGSSWRVGALGALWREVLERPHIRAVLGPDATAEDRPRAWPIPADIGRLPLSAGRALWVGDACAATDPMTGEGIGQALATGMWAAESIVNGADPLEVRHAYDKAVRSSLVPDHHMAETLSRALSHRKGARFAVWLSGATPWTRANFGRWLFEDEPRAVLATPRRWLRKFLARPGAYADRTWEVPDPASGGLRAGFTSTPSS